MDEDNSKTIILRENTSIVRLSSSITITNKLLFGDIESLFNEAFALMNSNDKGLIEENYLSNFEYDNAYEAKRKFRYYAIYQDNLKAINLLDKVIAIKSNHFWSYYLRGIANRNLRKFPLAILDFTRVIEFEPSFLSAYKRRAEARARLKDKAGAIQDYSKIVELDNRAFSYFECGRLKWEFRYIKEAHEDLSKAIELDSNYSEAYLYRGSAKIWLRDNIGAMEDYSTCLRLNPKNYTGYIWRGNLKMKLKDFEGAIKDYTTAIELYPTGSHAYQLSAIAKREAGYNEWAIQDYTKAIENDKYPTPSIFVHRGQLKVLLKDYDGAIEDFTKANDINSEDFSEACFERANVKVLLHDYEGAIKDYSKAIDSHNDSSILEIEELYRARSEAKKSVNDFEGAQRDIESFNNLIKK